MTDPELWGARKQGKWEKSKRKKRGKRGEKWRPSQQLG